MLAMALWASASVLKGPPMLFIGAAGWLCIIVHCDGGIKGHVELLGQSGSDKNRDEGTC